MKKAILIADSGGTSTNWYFNTGDEDVFFETESLHPQVWVKVDWSSLKQELCAYNVILENTSLYFFGAGCYNTKNADQLKQVFVDMGFLDVEVQSDVHAAAIATLGNQQGWVAILGTGSVFVKWNGNDVEKIIGGKGHLEGDEGSGYYFGKLVAEAYLNHKLSAEQEEYLKSIVRIDDLKSSYEEKDKYALARISKQLSSELDLFKAFHQQNLNLFYELHLQELNVKSLSVVGGYGYAISEILISNLNEKRITVDTICKSPIERLSAFIMKASS